MRFQSPAGAQDLFTVSPASNITIAGRRSAQDPGPDCQRSWRLSSALHVQCQFEACRSQASSAQSKASNAGWHGIPNTKRSNCPLYRFLIGFGTFGGALASVACCRRPGIASHRAPVPADAVGDSSPHRVGVARSCRVPSLCDFPRDLRQECLLVWTGQESVIPGEGAQQSLRVVAVH